jgi:TRAP-type C4-dicarboxylate transport system permease small subunit
MSRIASKIVQGTGYLAGVSTVLILLLVCVEVIARFFNSSTQIADEYAGYLNAAVIFLGLGYSLKEGAFIRIELLYDKFKGATFFWVKALITISALIFSAILTHFLILHTVYAYVQDVRAVSILQTPEWVPMSIVVLGCAVLTLQLAIFTFTKFKNLP